MYELNHKWTDHSILFVHISACDEDIVNTTFSSVTQLPWAREYNYLAIVYQRFRLEEVKETKTRYMPQEIELDEFEIEGLAIWI